MANSRATCCLLCLDVFLFLFLLLMVARSFHLAMNIAQTCLESTNQMSIWLVRPAIMNNQTLFLFLFLFSIMSWMIGLIAGEWSNQPFLSVILTLFLLIPLPEFQWQCFARSKIYLVDIDQSSCCANTHWFVL